MPRAREFYGLAAAILIATALFFRIQIANGFEIQFGDRFDGVIEVNLLQHWYNAFRGIEPWNDVNYFYPYRDTLGYNDGYFIYGVLFSLFRSCGIEMFRAAELVNVVMRAIGVIGMYALLRGPARCRLGWSLLGAVTFALANNSSAQARHAQLLMVSLTPMAGLFAWRFVEAIIAEQSTKILLWGSSFALLFSAWMLSGYYTAWFFLYFLEILAIVMLIGMGRDGRRLAIVRGRAAWRPLIVVLAIQIATLIPFLCVYLPKLSETGGHGWHSPRFYSANPIDMINVGPANLMWGGAYTWFRDALMPPLIDLELQSGITPLLFIVAMIAAFAAIRAPRGTAYARPVKWVAIAMLVSWLLTIRFGDVSLWRFAKPLLIGSRGVRVIARYQLVLMVPVTLLAIGWLDRWSATRARVAAYLLGALILIEQVDAAPPVRLARRDQIAMLAGIPPVPAACRSFYVISARPAPYDVRGLENPSYPHNVDAMTIAEARGIPTINGISSFNPPDWKPTNPTEPGYVADMRGYARAHGLHGVCALDVAKNGWSLDLP